MTELHMDEEKAMALNGKIDTNIYNVWSNCLYADKSDQLIIPKSQPILNTKIDLYQK